MLEQTVFCKTILSGDCWLDNVVISIDGSGFITQIESGIAADADEKIDGIVIPGMPNVHSHSFQRLIAGDSGPMGKQGDSFWSWREAMYSAANRVSPAHYEAVAAWVFTEMLKAGYTSCAEFHYVHHQANGRAYDNRAEMSHRLLAAAGDSGLALTLLPVLYCRAGFGEAGVNDAQRQFFHSPEAYLNLLELIQKQINNNSTTRLGIAFHSLRAVSGESAEMVLSSPLLKEVPIHIHIAEQPAEVQASIEHLGARPVEWLLDNFSVDENWCLVHATHLSDQELAAASACRALAGLCPTTEADLGDGMFRTDDWLQAGGRIGIGSDSNVRISVTDELRQLEYNERLKTGRRNVLTSPELTCGRYLYQHCAKDGASAVGQSVGRLEKGYRFDVVELDDSHELLLGKTPDAVMDTWVFAGDSGMIRSVWVSGIAQVVEGRHKDEHRLRHNFMLVMREFYE